MARASRLRTSGAHRTALARFLALFLALFAGAAGAAEFLSIAGDGVLMYDSPSIRGRRLFVASRGYPVEVVVNIDQWARVRDVAGDLAWVEKKSLSTRRTVLVTADTAEVLREASDAAPLVFRALKGVALEFIETTGGGWVRVRHADGTAGFVRIGQVWGL